MIKSMTVAVAKIGSCLLVLVAGMWSADALNVKAGSFECQNSACEEGPDWDTCSGAGDQFFYEGLQCMGFNGRPIHYKHEPCWYTAECSQIH